MEFHIGQSSSTIPLPVARFRGFPRNSVSSLSLAHNVRGFGMLIPLERWVQHVPRILSKNERRKWPRLQLAIPVFVRTRDESGEDSLEFATAINVSPGGALVAVRRSLPKSALVSLEIPSAPIGPANGLKASSRIMQAKAVWVEHLDDYHLLGLKFARSLSTDSTVMPRRNLRKSSPAV
jgi:hypothetical protein